MKRMLMLSLLACAACSQIKWPQTRMHGMWRNDFEGSQFCPAPARTCSYVWTGERTQPQIWLSFNGPMPPRFRDAKLGGLYEIEFLGRKTMFKGEYGHVGMSDHEIVVDRLISIREIEPPPKE